MKKEVFLAITIGFILGLVITFGIWTANKSLQQVPGQTKPTTTPEVSSAPASNSTPTPAPSATSSGMTINITSPADESLVKTSSVTITGKTSPSATVSILAENGETIVSSDANGDFSSPVNLEGGYNLISITAYDNAGNSVSLDLVITYSTSV